MSELTTVQALEAKLQADVTEEISDANAVVAIGQANAISAVDVLSRMDATLRNSDAAVLSFDQSLGLSTSTTTVVPPVAAGALL